MFSLLIRIIGLFDFQSYLWIENRRALKRLRRTTPRENYDDFLLRRMDEARDGIRHRDREIIDYTKFEVTKAS